MAPDLAGDHRDGVGRKANVIIQIEISDCLDQPDRSDLKQIVRLRPLVHVSFHYAPYQSDVVFIYFLLCCVAFCVTAALNRSDQFLYGSVVVLSHR